MKHPARTLSLPLALMATHSSLFANGFQQIDSYVGPTGSSGIVVHDRFGQTLYNVYGTRGDDGGVEILDFSNPSKLTPLGQIDMSVVDGLPVGSISSVAADPLGRGFGVASFIPLESGSNRGRVVFFDPSSQSVLHSVEVGYHPDMIRFSEDGTKVFVANEGEPISEGAGDAARHFDRAGSVSVIDLSAINSSADVGAIGAGQVADYDFSAANLAAGVGLSGVRVNPSNSASDSRFLDIEPEYVTQAGDKLFVSLQENNAIAELDLATGQWTAVSSLGTLTSLMDASDRDGGINIDDTITGMPMPDTIASYTVNGVTYLLTANEGDSRPPDFVQSGHALVGDDARFSQLGSGGRPALDPDVDAALDALYGGDAQAGAALGRLTLSLTDGDIDGDGDIDVPTIFGTRSFSIWDAATMTLVYDSGSDFEELTSALVPGLFNSDGTPASFDTRSDNKGPEPEGITVGWGYGMTLAFIGLERTGGVMVYDISNPEAPEFYDYFNTGERGAEGLEYIPAAHSPTGKPILLVGYEVSGQIGVYTTVPDDGSIPLWLAAPGLIWCWRRWRAAPPSGGSPG